MKKILTLISLACLAGCATLVASNDDALARETAKSIGGGVAPDSITVSDVDRGATTVKWQAATPNGQYSCSGDDMLHSVACGKK